MADEINVGRLVAEFVLEAETKKAEEQFKNSAENIKSSMKNLENTNAQINVDTKSAEEQAKKSAENIKSTMVNINGGLVPVSLGVETEQAEQQVKNTAENIKSTINNINSQTVEVPCQINWSKIESEWAQREQWIAERAQNIQVTVPINVEETSTEMMLEKIRGRLQELGLEASEVEKIIQGSFSDLSGYSNYEKQLSIIATKLEIQRRKVEELRKEQEQLSNSKLSSPTQVKNAEKVAKSYESESIKLKQLEAQYDRTSATQESYVDKKVITYQKGVAVAETAAEKEVAAQQKMQAALNRSNSALIFADLTTSLRTFNTVSPGVVYNIGTIIRQINLLKRASASGASTGIVAATTAIAIFGAVATLAVNYINSVKEKQEEARKKAVESADAYLENTNTVKELATEYINLKSKLDNSAMSHSEQREAQEQLISTQNQLISACGGEADALDLVNGKIDEQIKKINELNKEQAQKHINENINNYENALKELRKETKYEVGITDPVTDDETNAVFDSLRKKFEALQLTDGKLTLTIDAENAKDELNEFIDYVYALEKDNAISPELLNNIRHTAAKALSSVEAEEINEYKDIVEQYKTALDIVNEKSDEASAKQLEVWQKTYDTLNENISVIESMSSAYEALNSGKGLDNSKLLELCDTYPKLAKYIAETGDLSLANGEKLKAAQREMLESSITTLEQEKAELTLKQTKSDKENELLQKVTGTLKIYKQQLNDINSLSVETASLDAFKASVGDLSNAYATLSNGKQLDLNKTLELLDKYPELATVFSKGTNAIDDQRVAIENLYNAKKQEMLLSLQADKAEIESIIKRVSSSIEMMKSFDAGNNTNEGNSVINSLNEELSKYNDKLLVTEATINAINNLYVESGNVTDGTNQKLQEQLNLINHRKVMNDLTYGEEISWLQLLREQYATNAKERMSLDEKIYTAQQNYIQEQKQAYSDLYNTEIKNLEHFKALDQLSKEQELAWLNTIYSIYVLTAEERMSLEEKIYNVKRDMIQSELALLEHEKSMDRLSAEEEIKWLERINSQYEMSIEDRRDMELKLHDAKKSYEEEMQKTQQETLDKAIEALEKRRSTSRITYEEEIKQLREIYNTYKLTAKQQQQVLEQIRSLSNSAKSERSNQFGTLGDGVVEALKNQYQQQRDLEEKRINESIESWEKWEDETVSAIQSQIDALDKLSDAQQSEKERQEYENKRQATLLQLAYEKDDYNRKQLQKELARLDDEENERLAEEQRQKKKDELQAQIDSVKEQSNAKKDLLQAELDAIAENYEKLMSSYSLENEAYKIMLSKSQNEIVSFIGSYAPEYELLGQTLGEKLYTGLKNKISNIDYFFQQIQLGWQAYANRTATEAHQAVDRFWASRAEYEQKLNTMSSAPPDVNLTVIFNERVESPVQVARKMEEVTNNLVNQLRQ